MADKVDVFIPIYIGDYLGDTQDLNAEEHGAYLMILFTMWKTRAPVSFDKLTWVAKVSPERWPDVWGTIKRFFDVSAGMVTQGRLMRELEASLEKKRRASDRGRKGGLARGQAQAGCELDSSSACEQDEVKPARLTLTDLPKGSVSTLDLIPSGPSELPERTPARSENSAKEPAGTEYPREFELAWAATAKTGSKYKAFESWKRLGKPPAAVIAASWVRWSQLDGWRRGFIPHVVTWLNGRCWEQEPAEVRPRAGPPGKTGGNEAAVMDWHETGLGSGG